MALPTSLVASSQRLTTFSWRSSPVIRPLPKKSSISSTFSSYRPMISSLVGGTTMSFLEIVRPEALA